MSNENLENLDNEFRKVWLKTNDVPKAMSKWQENLQMVTAAMDPTPENFEQLETLMANWQDIMKKNKELLIAHQKDLKEKLAKGEPSHSKGKAAEKFKQC